MFFSFSLLLAPNNLWFISFVSHMYTGDIITVSKNETSFTKNLTTTAYLYIEIALQIVKKPTEKPWKRGNSFVPQIFSWIALKEGRRLAKSC